MQKDSGKAKAKARPKAFTISSVDTEELLRDYTAEETGEIFKALLAYANRGEEFESGDRSMRTLFKTIQANIERNYVKYEEKCERNRQIAQEREKKRKRTDLQEEKQAVSNETQTPPADTNVHVRARTLPNEIENENEINIQEEPLGSSMSELRSDAPSAPLPRERARETTEKLETRETLETTETTETAEKTTEKAQNSGEKVNCQRLCSQFNRAMRDARIPKIKRIAGQRREFLLARAREYGPVAVYRVILKAARSDFLNGGGNSGWVASFEWIFRPNNFPKVLEGYYDSNRHTVQQTNGDCGNETAHTAHTAATGGWANSRSGQRAAEQRERIQGYASVAGKWRQIADSDAAKVANKGQPAANVPR